MAIIIPGKTICKICGEIISQDNAVMNFPPLALHAADALLFFHDAGFHKPCFENHPLHETVLERIRKK